MKKMVVVFVITLVSNTNNAFQGSQLIQQDSAQYYNKSQFLDVAGDEYAPHDSNQQDIDEYDQYVSDEAHPPKISTVEALLREIMDFMLVRYIIIREMTHVYYHEIKAVINKWFNMLVKA